jgi:hypothetical protein
VLTRAETLWRSAFLALLVLAAGFVFIPALGAAISRFS